MLWPFKDIENESGRQVNSTVGKTMSGKEMAVDTLTSLIMARKLTVKGPACTQVFIYATVTLTIPVESHVMVKLPLDDDWSEPKST